MVVKQKGPSFNQCIRPRLHINMSIWKSLNYPLYAAKSLQSCPTLFDPIDCSPLGSAVPGILQARTLEWGAIAFSLLSTV